MKTAYLGTIYIACFLGAIAFGTFLVLKDHPWFGLLCFYLSTCTSVKIYNVQPENEEDETN